MKKLLIFIAVLVAMAIIFANIQTSINPKDPFIVLEFPKDEGMHKRVKQEWWYFNGHVSDEKGFHYGLMVCFFKNGKLYLAVADEHNNKFYKAIIKNKLKASREKLDISIGNNWWVERDKFTYQIHIEHSIIGLDLNMISERPPLLIGGKGIVSIGNGGSSYYYSQTRLKTEGKLTLNDREIKIRGTGWIDRQWGNWNSKALDGWEWFSIHLDNGSDILLYNIIDSKTGKSITPMVNIMNANGLQETFNSYHLKYLGYWTDPKRGDKFSHGWKINIPEKDIELTVMPTIKDQLLHPGLWEGSSKVTGRVGNQEVKGRAYVELYQRR